MLIQINTDNNIQGDVGKINHFSSILESTLGRFNQHITRIEVHLSDENSKKEGTSDKKCMLEVRVKGLQPIAVTHKAESLDFAVNGAAENVLMQIVTR